MTIEISPLYIKAILFKSRLVPGAVKGGLAMLIYEELPEEFKNAANGYGLSGEIARISGPVTYENNTFYEIEFIKKSFFNLKKSTAGIIIIDGQGNAVESREMIRTLLKMFYYYKLFFYSYKKDFGSALKSEEQLKAEEQEYQEASDAARCLMDEGTDGAGSVKFIIDKLPVMRREANNILRTFLENIDNYKEAGIFNREIFEELMDMYDRVMLMSFQRVKFINNA
jgi:hypothetical protein